MLNKYYINFILAIPLWITKVSFDKTGEFTIELKHKYILQFFEFISKHTSCQLKILIDITCVDFPTKKERFSIIYHVLSIAFNTRVRIKVPCSESSVIPSIEHIYSSANWFEREVWDLFGVFFSNNLDLRRILTDYGFEGHPLRKDFPLSGYVEARFDEMSKRVILEPIEITQEFRVFQFANVWKTV
jgi:NADH/F420H2 dehydrogenase subunit C